MTFKFVYACKNQPLGEEESIIEKTEGGNLFVSAFFVLDKIEKHICRHKSIVIASKTCFYIKIAYFAHIFHFIMMIFFIQKKLLEFF